MSKPYPHERDAKGKEVHLPRMALETMKTMRAKTKRERVRDVLATLPDNCGVFPTSTSTRTTTTPPRTVGDSWTLFPVKPLYTRTRAQTR